MAARSGWRTLGLFWTGLLVVAAGAAATLQTLGPLPPAPPAAETAPAATPAAPGAHEPPAPPSAVPAHEAATPPVAAKKVAAPDPALLERAPNAPLQQIPRIGPDGRAPRLAYAAPVAAVPAGTPKVALLIVGFGLSERDSRTAIDDLPGPVSFGVSAYAGAPTALYDTARAAGHELLASIPMEPFNYPQNDEGAKALMTGLSPDENRANLFYALARIQGAVGATGASDGMRGERFADLSGAVDPILDEIARRGLLYIDPRPDRPATRPGFRSIDIVLDDSPARAEIEAKLLALERIARQKGAAIGLAGPLRPVTVERIAAWTKSLEAKGLALVPVSALVSAP